MSDYIDQEIDLRPHVEAILDNWYWIAAATILAAVLGFAVSFIITPTYRATALIAVTEPNQRVQFDPRIQSLSGDQPLLAYPELALSDALLGEVLGEMSDGQIAALSELRGILDAEPGSDPRIIRFTATHQNPQTAAEIANLWAEVFVEWAGQVYGNMGDDQLVFFEDQLSNAATKLELTEGELIAYQAHNRSNILENELVALQQTQADYLAKRRQTELILQDVESLLVSAGNSDRVQGSTEQLASLLLQARAFGGVWGETESASPLQIQISPDSSTLLTADEEQKMLSDLKSALSSQSSQIGERLSQLEPQMLSLQRQLQEATAVEDRLVRDLQVAEETYVSLSRAVDEKRITSADGTSGVRLASKTAVPEKPSGPRRLLITIVAALFGLVASTLAILILSHRKNVGHN